MERPIEASAQRSSAQTATRAVAQSRAAAIAHAAQDNPLNGSSAPEEGPGSEAQALKRKGDLLARDSRYAEAEVLYRRALGRCPPPSPKSITTWAMC